MSEHTPGPWVLKPARSIVGGWAVWAEYEPGKHCQVADIEPWPNDPDTAPESEANARLIAAAPELLAAWLAVHAILLKGTVNTPDYEWEDMAGDVMRAVARARGEAVL